jgi:hypothetical protein
MHPSKSTGVHPVWGKNGGTIMHPTMAHELAKLRMAERHAEAARERLAREAKAAAAASDEEHESRVWHRWGLRRLSSRLMLSQSGA